MTESYGKVIPSSEFWSLILHTFDRHVRNDLFDTIGEIQQHTDATGHIFTPSSTCHTCLRLRNEYRLERTYLESLEPLLKDTSQVTTETLRALSADFREMTRGKVRIFQSSYHYPKDGD